MMSPDNSSMPGELVKALTESFGSVAKFKDDFKAAGAGQFGSGWAWLVKDTDGSLKVTKTENGVNPVCFGQTALPMPSAPKPKTNHACMSIAQPAVPRPRLLR